MQRRWMGSYRVSGEGTDRDHEILMTRQLTYGTTAYGLG